MTFSILARDPGSGQMGGAAATGSLCVGGWVLRGDSRAGMSACQGAAPSTLWGEDILTLMRDGCSAPQAMASVTASDPGREWRQVTALDRQGNVAARTGRMNNDWRGDLCFESGAVAGNILAGPQVLQAMVEAFQDATGPLHERLIRALFAADAAGGDVRGLESAALLVVGADMAPLNLRVDLADDPLAALDRLRRRATSGDYAAWAAQVPNVTHPHSRLKSRED